MEDGLSMLESTSAALQEIQIQPETLTLRELFLALTGVSYN